MPEAVKTASAGGGSRVRPWRGGIRLAGLALPCLIVLGLMALPYLDRKPAGSGCYTIRRRQLVYLLFQSAFWLWILLIVVGVFLRGPDWSFFGPYQIRVP